MAGQISLAGFHFSSNIQRQETLVHVKNLSILSAAETYVQQSLKSNRQQGIGTETDRKEKMKHILMCLSFQQLHAAF